MEDKLELVELDYMVREVRVLFLKDYYELPTPSGVINARKGDEMNLPRWQARYLEELGVVDVRENGLTLDVVNMYHFRERRTSAANKLSQLPQDFYRKASELVEKLNKLIRESPSHMLLRDREVLEKNLIELGEARMMKLIRLAQTGGGEELRSNMTPEEQLLYDSVKGIVESWRGYIRKLFPGV
ncbi:MAG: DNA replication complex GINS family protein [Desulfurococcales archaeon]|nr:DNA replication complex GINS family protein [Desulfurococcales archaeon]